MEAVADFAGAENEIPERDFNLLQDVVGAKLRLVTLNLLSRGRASRLCASYFSSFKCPHTSFSTSQGVVSGRLFIFLLFARPTENFVQSGGQKVTKTFFVL